MTNRLLICGNPDDVNQTPRDLPAIFRYNGPVMETLQEIADEPGRERCFVLVLTHHSAFFNWQTPVPLFQPKPFGSLVDFSYTAATASLDAWLDPLWWPNGIERIGVCLPEAYESIVTDAQIAQDVEWMRGTPHQQARQMRAWFGLPARRRAA